MGVLCAGLCQGLCVLSSLAHLSEEETALLLDAFFAYSILSYMCACLCLSVF